MKITKWKMFDTDIGCWLYVDLLGLPIAREVNLVQLLQPDYLDDDIWGIDIPFILLSINDLYDLCESRLQYGKPPIRHISCRNIIPYSLSDFLRFLKRFGEKVECLTMNRDNHDFGIEPEHNPDGLEVNDLQVVMESVHEFAPRLLGLALWMVDTGTPRYTAVDLRIPNKLKVFEMCSWRYSAMSKIHVAFSLDPTNLYIRIQDDPCEEDTQNEVWDLARWFFK